MKRRDFLQQISFGAGFVGLSPLIANACIADTSDKKLGVALVGLGSYSTYQLAVALEQTKFCKLSGIVTGTPAKAEAWIKKYKIPKKNCYDYKTFDRIIDNPDIDVIYVVLPNAMHHEYVIRAAQSGKHVICEKPMALTVKECEEMIAACEKAKKQLAIGYRLHFEPFNLEMARLGQQKVFGKVNRIKADFGFTIGDPSQWRLNKVLAGGGPLMDVGIYAVNGCRYVTGEEPISVKATFNTKTDLEKFKEVEEALSW
ncbi:MAG: Gfo/Idh/MocA family oxidoreductase, partial [Verrucomicrobia bacterium]|nr:Gfo/Idh/MocA family oxidoreductase [Cytophagales bacterium]